MSIIRNSEAVEDLFAYWPKFCDGKIQQFQFETKGNINLKVSYIDSDKSMKATVSICFKKVSQVELFELRSENVIDQLTIEQQGSLVSVELEACSGLNGKFNCQGVEVVYVAT